jgi:hypothetical protein
MQEEAKWQDKEVQRRDKVEKGQEGEEVNLPGELAGQQGEGKKRPAFPQNL